MADLAALLTYAQVAELTGLHPRSIRRQVVAGRLNPIVLGERCVRFRVGDVKGWIERSEAVTRKALAVMRREDVVHARLAQIMPYGSESRGRSQRVV